MATASQLEYSAEPAAPAGRLLGLTWAHLLNDGSANYLPGILPALLISLNEPVAMAGAFMASLILAQSLQPLSGYLADRLGGKSLIILGLAGSAIGGGLLGFAHNVWLGIALLAMIGVGNTLFHPQALAAVRSVAGSRHGLSMSVFLVGGELGRGLWPSVASALVVSHGLAALWVTAIPALFTLPLLSRWAPSLPARRAHLAHIDWRGKLRPLAALVGFGSLRSLTIFGAVTFIPILWHLRGGGLVAGASIITTLLVVGIVGNLAGGHLSDRLGYRGPLVVTSLAGALLIALLPMAAGVWLWVAAGVLGIAMFSSLPVTVLIGQSIFPENRALGSGVSLGATNALGSVGVLTLGFVAGKFGVDLVLYVLAAASLLSALFAAMVPGEGAAHA